MTEWKEVGKGEYFRDLPDGETAKILEYMGLWRVVVGNRKVDNVYLSVTEAIEVMDAWVEGRRDISFHPVDREWFGDDKRGYARECKDVDLEVDQAPCKRWIINRLDNVCFRNSEEALRYADERLP